MKLQLKKGSTSKILHVFVADSSSTTGAGLTGLAYNSSGLSAYYCREGSGSASSITLANMTLGTFTSGGFKELDATNMPGFYQFCPPDAALASGAASVVFLLKGVTNMAPLPLELQLVDFDPNDAVRLGLTAIPNVASGSDGSIMVRGTTQDIALKSLTISNSAGTAVTFASTGSNGSGIATSGNGSGHGVLSTGGATGNGINAVGGSTSGSAIRAAGTAGNANGFESTGQGSGAGILATAGATGHGVFGKGGTTSGAGFRAEALGGDSHGIHCIGLAAGAGVYAIGGSSGPGILSSGGTTGNAVTLVGGSTSGHGISVTTTSGHGVVLAPAGANMNALLASGSSSASGHAISLVGGIAGGDGLSAVASAANGRGINAAGQGSGPGFRVQGGATGIGLAAIGGSTSGDAIDCSVTSGIELDADITGNITGNLSGSVGSVVSGVTIAALESMVAHFGTAQAGSAGSITLASGASATTDLFKGCLIAIYGGTGSGQCRMITAYNGSTKVGTIDWNWATTPDNTSQYKVLFADGPSVNSSLQVSTTSSDPWATSLPGGYSAGTAGKIIGDNLNAAVSSRSTLVASDVENAVLNASLASHVSAGTVGRALQVIRDGTAQAGTDSTLTLDASASAVDDFYKGAIVQILGGTGAGQFREILSYVGSSKIATIDSDWATTPDNTSVFVIRPGILGSTVPSTQAIANAVLDEPISSHSAAGTLGKMLNDSESLDVDDAVEASPAPMASSFAGSTSLSNVDEKYTNRFLVFVSGGNAGEMRKITGYDGSTQTFSFAVPFLAAPAAGDSFKIGGYGGT